MSAGHVAILMATYNGEAHLPAQLASFLHQTHTDWSLVAADDGSRDRTPALLRAFAAGRSGRHRVEIRRGPGAGSTRNFLALLSDPLAAEAGFAAFSDQDDIWLPRKLERALRALAPAGARPALYGSRTIVADARARPGPLSPLFRHRPSFANALVQSIAGGNTMVLNAAARDLAARAAARLTTDPVCHDWWLYQIVSGGGGEVFYDAEPTVLYRQHGANQIGANRSLGARAARLALLLGGRFSQWSDRNIAALESAGDLLTPEAREVLARFRAVRARRGARALSALLRSGLHRQTLAGNISLAVAAGIGRL